MGRSILLGTEIAAAEAAGRDVEALGPSDTSDSGSDVAGIEGSALAGDPGLPVDVMLQQEAAPLVLPGTALDKESPADLDIGVDRVVHPGAQPDDAAADDEDADLAFVDEIQAADTPEEEEEDEEDDEGDEGNEKDNEKDRQERQPGRGTGPAFDSPQGGGERGARRR